MSDLQDKVSDIHTVVTRMEAKMEERCPVAFGKTIKGREQLAVEEFASGIKKRYWVIIPALVGMTMSVLVAGIIYALGWK